MIERKNSDIFGSDWRDISRKEMEEYIKNRKIIAEATNRIDETLSAGVYAYGKYAESLKEKENENEK